MLLSIFRRHQSGSRALRKIPPKLVGIILAFLSIPDQVCFSLSCKYLYSSFNLFLDAKGIRLPQLLPPETPLRLCRKADIEQRRRIQLLRRLEDSRWKFCSDCWNLHPHSAWHAPQLIWLFSQSLYFSPRQLSNRRCIPYAGEVDICPCFTITFRDKLRLIDILKCAGEKSQNTEYYVNDILYHFGLGKVRRCLGHKCNFTKHPSAKVQVDTKLWVDESQSLRVLTSYTIRVSHGSSSQMLPLYVKTLSHKEVGNWLRKLFDEAGSNFSGWHKDTYFAVSSPYREMPKDCNSPYILDIWFTRGLGNGEWPNGTWNRNRRNYRCVFF